MKKPDFNEENMTSADWDKMLEKGMNDLYKDLAKKNISVAQLIDGKIVKEVPSINPIHKSFSFSM